MSAFIPYEIMENLKIENVVKITMKQTIDNKHITY